MFEHENGIGMLVVYVPEGPGAVALYAELGPAVDPPAVFRLALEAMHLWSRAGELTLGVLPDTDILTASALLPVDEDLSEQLGPAIDRFADRAMHWARLAQAIDEPDEDGTPKDGDADPAGGFPKIMG